MANFQSLQDRASNLAQLEGWTDTNPAPNWPLLVNLAWYEFAIDCELYRSQDSSLVTTNGTSRYVVPGKWGKIEAVSANGVPLRASSVEAERFRNPGWMFETGSSGTPPAKFVCTAPGTITIVPAPYTSAQMIVVNGVSQPPAMVLATDEPGQANGTAVVSVPDKYHDAIAQYAAYLQGLAYSLGTANARMADFLRNYNERVAEMMGAVNMPYRRGQSRQAALPQGAGGQ